MEKLTKTITIGLTETNQCGISVSPDTDCATAFQLLGTLALHLLQAYTEVATKSIDDNKTLKSKEREAAKTGMKDSLYDAMDNVFSTVLNNYYPDHIKYTIEDEAILELVNKKIEDRYNAMPKSEKAKYQQAYNKIKLEAEFNRRTHGTTNSQGSTSTKA